MNVITTYATIIGNNIDLSMRKKKENIYPSKYQDHFYIKFLDSL